MNLVGEPRLEDIRFFGGIPKVGRLWTKREVIYEGHAASIGEADLLFVGGVGGLHVDCCCVVVKNLCPCSVVWSESAVFESNFSACVCVARLYSYIST